MACGPVTAMRSLSGALRFSRREGAAHRARRGDNHAGRLPGGREHYEAPQQESHGPYRNFGPALGARSHGGRSGHPPRVRVHQRRVAPAGTAVRARRQVPERRGPPAAWRGFRGPRPRAAPRPAGRGRRRTAGSRSWRTLAARTGAGPDDRVLAARPDRHSPRRPRAGVRGSSGKSLAAGPFRDVCARIPRTSRSSGTRRRKPAAPLPAGGVPGRTRLGAICPGRRAAAATAAQRTDAAPPRHSATRSSRCAPDGGLRPSQPAPPGGLRPSQPAPPGPRLRPAARTPAPLVSRPSATARSRPGGAPGSNRPGLPTRAGTTAARTRRQRRLAAARPRLPATARPRLRTSGQPWLRTSGQHRLPSAK
jgi:hypothetical protein